MMADAIIPHSPHWKNSLKKENILLALYAPSPHCALLGYLFLSSAAICVSVWALTLQRLCVFVCVCVLRAHTGSPVTVCRLALGVRSMNGKHSQLCESPISNWVGLPGWSAVLPHIPVLIAPSFPHLSFPQGATQSLAPFFLGRWNRSRLEVSHSLNYESRILMPGYFSTCCECDSKCVSLVPPASILVL